MGTSNKFTPKQVAAQKAFKIATKKAKNIFNKPGNKKSWSQCIKESY